MCGYTELCTKSALCEEDFSRKGAKGQSAAAFLSVFFGLCVFAPLREKAVTQACAIALFSATSSLHVTAAVVRYEGVVSKMH